jgi:hypothetical protein
MNSQLPGQALMQHGGGALQVAGGGAQDRIRTEQGPVGERARRPVRHADAPGVETRRPSARRSNGTCVWPQTTNASANHANGLLTSTISSSSRALA